MGLMTRLRNLEGVFGPLVPTTLAAAGSVQGDAAQIVSNFTLVTGADATKGVKLPTAVAGRSVTIKNSSASALKVWPFAGDAINAIAADSAMTIAAQTCPTFRAYNTTTWYSNPLLPS